MDKKENDPILSGEVLFEVETDKATMEYESPEDGYVAKIISKEGETADVNQLVAIISDDLSMKSLKGVIKENTIKTFNSGCNLALHCNGNFKEMQIVGKNSPLINKFILKKTSQFYKILS